MSRSDAIRMVGVIVPAHNERAAIGPCLQAIRLARAQLIERSDHPPVVRIVVALDACIDGTAALVASFPDVEAVTLCTRRVGAARAAGVRHLLRHATTATGQIWLANTDADSIVPRHWLTSMVDSAQHGAHVVLGTAVPAEQQLASTVASAWRRRHLLREDHPHVHGANFGVRADTYLSLGGWISLATGEDVGLAARARAAGHVRIARTAKIPVQTSGRQIGRAPHGFADYLAALASAG